MESQEVKTFFDLGKSVRPLNCLAQDDQAQSNQIQSQTQGNRTRDLEGTQLRNTKGKISREALVSWLFVIGSLMFVLDAILENTKNISFSSLLHLSASILFTIGSVLFTPSNSQK